MDTIEQIKSEVEQDIEKVRAEAAGMGQQAEALVKEAPPWKLIVVAACALCVVGYLFWCLVHIPVPKPDVFTKAAPAVMAPKVAGPTLAVPLKVVPKAAVRKALPSLVIPEGDEVIDTADIPPMPNGVKAVTFMDVSTGEATTQYTPKPAPWFALEDRNTVGAGYEASTEGSRVPIYYRRDILRVKDLHLVGEVGGKIPVGAGKVEGHAGAYAEWRF